MAAPKVSVLMSVYNGQKYLREAIDSILNQTFKDFEFLIIDDGSTDSSADIIRSYSDSRIRLIQNEKNIGLTRSLNKGLKLTRGEYIARMDADDIALSKRLETMLNFLEKNRDVGLLGSSFIYIDENGKELRISPLATGDKEIRKKLLVSNHFGSEIFRREIGEKVDLYREEFRYAQDYDLCLRIAEVSKLRNIREPLYKYRISLHSISVAKKVEQDRYADFARELARERRQFGKDRLQTSSKEENHNILSDMNFEGKNKNGLIAGYYFWGRRFYIENDYKSALRFLLRPFPYNFFNKDMSLLILKAAIKLIFPPKIQFALKRMFKKCRKSV